MNRIKFNYIVVVVYSLIVSLYIYAYSVPLDYCMVLVVGSFIMFLVYEVFIHRDDSHEIDHGTPVFYLTIAAPILFALINQIFDSSKDNMRIMSLMFCIIIGRAISEILLDKFYYKKK